MMHNFLSSQNLKEIPLVKQNVDCKNWLSGAVCGGRNRSEASERFRLIGKCIGKGAKGLGFYCFFYVCYVFRC